MSENYMVEGYGDHHGRDFIQKPSRNINVVRIKARRNMYSALEVSAMKNTNKNRWTVLLQVIERRPVEKSKSAANPTTYRNYWLIDMMGTKVPAVVFGDDVAFFERSLLPYKRYYISNASIRPTKKEYLVGDYLFTWYLSSSTPVKPLLEDVPMTLPCHFDYTPFAEFSRHADREDDITVKGLLVKSFHIKYVKQGLWARDYVLINDEKLPVILTTWKYGPEPVSIELDHDMHNPPLLIAERLKITTFNGISLSTKQSTSFLLDPPVSEAALLKQWYKDNFDEILGLINERKYKDPTMFLETPQRADLIPINLAFKSIDTIKTCWVEGKISLIPGQKSFWFPSCSGCNRSLNAEDGSEEWCILCEKNMVVKYRCHFDVWLRDESGALPTDLYTPDAEVLLGCSAVELEEKILSLAFLEAKIKAAIEDKHVVCFIKVYDRLVRGVNMRTFPIVKLYAYEDLYPSNKVVAVETNVGPSTIIAGTVQLDETLEKETTMQGNFFTPTTKRVLDEVSQEMVMISKQDQPTGSKRSLFLENAANAQVSAAEPPSANVVLNTQEGNDSNVVVMETKSPVKKNRNREKID